MERPKLCVIPDPPFVEAFKTWTSRPLPATAAELCGALESRAVDGQEKPVRVVLSNGLHEVQRYVSVTDKLTTFHDHAAFKLYDDELVRVPN